MCVCVCVCVSSGWRRRRFPVRRWCCWRNTSWWCRSSVKTTFLLPNWRTWCWTPRTWRTPSTRSCMYVHGAASMNLLTRDQQWCYSTKSSDVFLRLYSVNNFFPLSILCLQLMQLMYQECNLVHADLSEYNMLWHEGKVRLCSCALIMSAWYTFLSPPSFSSEILPSSFHSSFTSSSSLLSSFSSIFHPDSCHFIFLVSLKKIKFHFISQLKKTLLSHLDTF